MANFYSFIVLFFLLSAQLSAQVQDYQFVDELGDPLHIEPIPIFNYACTLCSCNEDDRPLLEASIASKALVDAIAYVKGSI